MTQEADEKNPLKGTRLSDKYETRKSYREDAEGHRDAEEDSPVPLSSKLPVAIDKILTLKAIVEIDSNPAKGPLTIDAIAAITHQEPADIAWNITWFRSESQCLESSTNTIKAGDSLESVKLTDFGRRIAARFTLPENPSTSVDSEKGGEGMGRR